MAESEKPEGGWSSLFRMPRLNHLRNSLRVRSRDRLSVKQPAHRLQCHRHNKLRTLPRNRTMEPWDVTIVGGGILGTSFAYWLANRYDGRTAVLEKESQAAMHTSRRTTGVVHRPFYLDPVGRKVFARSAQTAYGMWKAFAAQRGLPWLPVGTFEVAVRPDQVSRLEKYRDWGLANGMGEDELALLTAEDVRRLEPNVHSHGAIWSKTDTAVDYQVFTQALREYADLHFRGEYWEVGPEWHYLCGRNIYTVPRHPELPFLDPHWIVRADGRREIGPNAVPVPGPYTYHGFFDDPAEAVKKLLERPVGNKLAALFNPDFMMLATEEWASSISKRAMAKRVQEFLPALHMKYLTRPGTAGVRAQVVDPHGNFVKEAIEIPGPHSFHVVNYNSPGATGSPAYTAWIVNLLANAGHLDHLKAKAARPDGLWDFDTVCAAIETPPPSG